jgi:hypothetical protein
MFGNLIWRVQKNNEEQQLVWAILISISSNIIEKRLINKSLIKMVAYL